jgi:hypothetical protein
VKKAVDEERMSGSVLFNNLKELRQILKNIFSGMIIKYRQPCAVEKVVPGR